MAIVRTYSPERTRRYAKRARAQIVSDNMPQKLAGMLTAPNPPDYCPWCRLAVSRAVKDDNGNWTWDCLGACNP